MMNFSKFFFSWQCCPCLAGEAKEFATIGAATMLFKNQAQKIFEQRDWLKISYINDDQNADTSHPQFGNNRFGKICPILTPRFHVKFGTQNYGFTRVLSIKLRIHVTPEVLSRRTGAERPGILSISFFTICLGKR